MTNRNNALQNLRDIINGYNQNIQLYNLNLMDYNRNITSILHIIHNNNNKIGLKRRYRVYPHLDHLYRDLLHYLGKGDEHLLLMMRIISMQIYYSVYLTNIVIFYHDAD